MIKWFAVFSIMAGLLSCESTGSDPSIGSDFSEIDVVHVGSVNSADAMRIFDGEPAIYISSQAPSELEGELAEGNRISAMRLIYQLGSADRGVMQPLSREQSVIYVVYDPVPIGTVFETRFTYTRSPESMASKPDDRPFTQAFQQVVSASSSQQPLIIVNGAISIFKGDFNYELRMNGRLIASRRIVMVEDL